jgi:hypothetical protein
MALQDLLNAVLVGLGCLVVVLAAIWIVRRMFNR